MSQKSFSLPYFVLFVLSRLVPHPTNLTAAVATSVFTGARCSKKWAILSTLLALLLTDAVLACIQGHNLFGSWSLFTYSGLLSITWFATRLRLHSIPHQAAALLSCAVFFWLWTNVGCFLTMNEYSKNLSGLMQCFTLAIPFLEHQLIGNLLWFFLITGVETATKRRLNSTALPAATTHTESTK